MCTSIRRTVEAWGSLVRREKEKAAVREEDAGQTLPSQGQGWKQRCSHNPGYQCIHSCPERTAAALLEGEIISSRISRKIQPIIFL